MEDVVSLFLSQFKDVTFLEGLGLSVAMAVTGLVMYYSSRKN